MDLIQYYLSFHTPLTAEELCDDLCKHCPAPEEGRGTYGTPNGYYSCEGRWCGEAYDNYLDDYYS